MTDRLEKAVRDGNRAALLQDDPLIKEALDKLEAQSIEALVECSDTNDLIIKRADVAAIRRFRQTLSAYIVNGKVAQHALKEIEKEKRAAA